MRAGNQIANERLKWWNQLDFVFENVFEMSFFFGEWGIIFNRAEYFKIIKLNSVIRKKTRNPSLYNQFWLFKDSIRKVINKTSMENT